MLRRNTFLLVALFAIGLLTITASGPRPAAAETGLIAGQNIASETYYRLDPAAATITARIEARVQNAASTPMESVVFFTMPGAQDIVVQQDGSPVEYTLMSEDPDLELLGDVLFDYVDIVEATPAKPLVPNVAHEFTVTYTLPAAEGEQFSIEPGAIDAALVSQGPGSFLYIDVPNDGDNYFDPGCLLAADQPDDVTSGGYERWICGETTLIAFSSNNASVLEDCAAADARCRQKVPVWYGGFAQTITNPDLQGTLTATVAMQNGPVELEFKFFRRDAAWAERQFAIAQQVLPQLEQLFAFPYEFDHLAMRESNFIELAGAAGLAFSDIGTVLIAPGVEETAGLDESITVHELAHQWAGYQLAEPWIWEGLAEWATRTLAPQFGYTPGFTIDWHDFGVDIPLSQFRSPGDNLPGAYWYRKAGDFWFAYEEAVGGREPMRQILGKIGTDKDAWPLPDRWFHDRGEEVSGANLDSLMLQWVYVPLRAEPLLEQRRAARAEVDTLVARAAGLSLSGIPAGLRPSLDAWDFTAVGSDVATANAILDRYAAALAESDEAGLPRTGATIQEAWATEPLFVVDRRVSELQSAVDAIVDARANVPADAPALAHSEFEAALAAFGEGRHVLAADKAERAESLIVLIAEADAAITRARSVEQSFSANPFERVGMLFSDPAGDLAKAQAAYDRGEPETAIILARDAADGWNGAQARGALYLAVVAGAIGIVSLAVFLLMSAGGSKPQEDATRRVQAAMAPAKPGNPPNSDRRPGS